MLKNIPQINIELCAKCNLRCRCCALDHTRPQQFMKPSLYQKLLDELLSSEYNVRDLCLSHSGEVLQHPHFEEFLAITKRYKEAGGTGRIIMDSNMVLLNPDMIDKIIGYDVIDVIVCSIDGRNKTSFEKLRPPAKYEPVMANLHYLLSYDRSERPEVWWNNGHLPETSAQMPSLEFTTTVHRVDRLTTYIYHDWGGQIANPRGDANVSATGFCKFIFGQIVLTASGHIGKCCYDLNGYTTYGDFKVDSLKDIYHSRQRKTDLTKMLMQFRSRVKGCRNCTIR